MQKNKGDLTQSESVASEEFAPVKVKPLLRGKSHLLAAVFAVVASGWLITLCSTRVALVASVIYSIALVSMFSMSAFYHVPNWPKEMRARLRRIDLSAIYLLIAGTATPLFALCLSDQARVRALALIWSGAIAGILLAVFWTRAPKPLTAALCVGLGWMAAPFIVQMAPHIGTTGVVLLVMGGVFYSLGAVIYSIRRPDPIPHIFGFHEVFHVLVIIAVICHYMAIVRVVTNQV